MIRKAKWMAAVLAALLVAFTAASAQTAQDITASLVLSGSQRKTLEHVRDGRYDTYWMSSGGSYAYIELSAPEGAEIGSVYVQFYEDGIAFELQTLDEHEQWQRAAVCDTAFLTGYAQLCVPARRVRIRPVDARRLGIAQLHAFAPGEKPDWVQTWQPPLDKADLLVISAHPDDEMLFMGGTIPYYAGERGLDVQVAYLVGSMPYRRLELLDGLWLCGVRHYPELGPFPDTYQLRLSQMYALRGWSEEHVLRYVTGLYRRFQPDVVVTHDVGGEYGHGAHQVAADAAQRCIALAADEGFQHKKLAQTRPWQVKKLYLHLYDQGALRMDWRQPLEAFGGRTAFDMAQAAFACHISQQNTDYHVLDEGPYDNARFGLAFSTVGEDIHQDDFFENLPN